MRLTAEQIRLIRQVIEETAGADAQVKLFGSRLLDDRKGGDIDLLVTIPHDVENAALLASRIEARLQRVLGERKIDVLLAAPNLASQAIHRIAEKEGHLL